MRGTTCSLHFFFFQKKEKYQRATRQEIRENEEIRPEDQNMENISLNHNANTEEETKPKRVGVHQY